MSPPVEATAKPYKGTSSYQTEDADLFFGRDQDAELVIGRILSSRLTLLHAQSGAGKTSLLNARIIPGLEGKAWFAVRILPQNDPVESVCVTTTQAIFPPLEAEILALKRACDGLFGGKQDIELERILRSYDALRPGDPLRRDLVRPLTLGESDASTAAEVETRFVPHFCRLLRAGVTIDQFSEHFEAILQIGAGDSTPPLRFTSDTRASDLANKLREPLFQLAWKKTLTGLSIPTPGLWPFFHNLFHTYGSRRSRFGIVLLLDQFEEVFTRFVDSGSASRNVPSQPNWRLRWELLEQIKIVYTEKTILHGTTVDNGAPAQEYLPLRLLISMRDEYVAQLDPIREFVPDLDANAYHLALLTVPQAEAAIKKPASEFHYTYSEALYKSLIRQLAKEERYVEPAHVQIVCEKLWQSVAGKVAQLRDPKGEVPSTGEQPQIDEKVLQDMDGVQGILGSFFQEFLHGQNFGVDERLETLELLEPLLTPNKTRNILEKHELVQARFRDANRREELLARLVDRTIVRVEPRLRGLFVEITHEFLIDPILAAIATGLSGNLDYTRFRAALRTLAVLVPRNCKSVVGRFLARPDFDALNAHAGGICWDDCSIELMLRNAIVLGADADITARWLKRFCKSQWNEEDLFTGDLQEVEDDLPMSLEQLRTVNEFPDRIGSGDSRRLKRILSSQIRLAADEERADVVQWTRRFADEVA